MDELDNNIFLEDYTDQEIIQKIIRLGELIQDVKYDNELISPTNYELRFNYHNQANELVKELERRGSLMSLPKWIRFDMAYQKKLKSAKAFQFVINNDESLEKYSCVIMKKYVYVRKNYEKEEFLFKVDKQEFLDTINNLHLLDWGGREYINYKNNNDELDWFVDVGYTYDNRDKFGGIKSYPSGLNQLFNKLRKWSKRRI